ncbi:HD domain-containing protein [Clostridium aminobutyricum]|uniref:HD domain-containing protein n=1 Tax=Clostridium aminobutyricum TaxID=33953 RepID=A0A939D8U7_CLOAM|nr:HD domain-containing protein [Clostridium aminobutyricum]MBN7773296.1 HD domain-containing protein [Clostridium aminobutyricum]
MHTLLRLQSALLKEIDKYEKIVPERDHFIDWERVHISSCAKLGYILAEERGVDPIMAACACAIHDYGRIVTGKQAGHAEAGYLPVQEFLRGTGLFNEEQILELAITVKNHSNKSEVGSPLEEIVKDADVLDFHQYGYTFPRKEQQDRLARLLKKGLSQKSAF